MTLPRSRDDVSAGPALRAGEFMARIAELLRQVLDHGRIPAFLSRRIQSLLKPGGVIS